MTTFDILQNSIKIALNRDIQAQKIEMVDAMAMLWILGKAKNESELRELIDIYQSDYSFLQEVLLKEKSEQETESANDLQIILSSYLKENPEEAIKVSKFVSKNPSTSVAELVVKFPEVKKYLA
jgi:hypothetical protein